MDRKKFITLIVVLFTVILAGVAVFTAVRLYQQRQVSVAPTAPTSIPRAAETVSCQPLTFSLATTPVCGGSCNPSDPNSCPQDHTCSTTTNKCVLNACLAAGATCDANQCNEITPANPECGGSCNPSDPSTCPDDHTCNTTTNTCELTVCTEAGRTCTADNCSLAPQCGDTCSSNSECPTDHTCNTTTNTCELTACTQAGKTCTNDNCSLTPQCGDTCTTNADCPNDHTCSSGKCVLNDCLQSGVSCASDKCSTTTTTQAPAPTAAPELPVAGTGMPTVALGVIGLLTLVGALFFAL